MTMIIVADFDSVHRYLSCCLTDFLRVFLFDQVNTGIIYKIKALVVTYLLPFPEDYSLRDVNPKRDLILTAGSANVTNIYKSFLSLLLVL